MLLYLFYLFYSIAFHDFVFLSFGPVLVRRLCLRNGIPTFHDPMLHEERKQVLCSTEVLNGSAWLFGCLLSNDVQSSIEVRAGQKRSRLFVRHG